MVQTNDIYVIWKEVLSSLWVMMATALGKKAVCVSTCFGSESSPGGKGLKDVMRSIKAYNLTCMFPGSAIVDVLKSWHVTHYHFLCFVMLVSVRWTSQTICLLKRWGWTWWYQCRRASSEPVEAWIYSIASGRRQKYTKHYTGQGTIQCIWQHARTKPDKTV